MLDVAVSIPRPGALVTFDQMEAAERQIADTLGDMHDIPTIEDTRDRLRAIEQYLRGKQMHLPALGAQRRLEARIGQLLGDAIMGRPVSSAAPEVSSMDKTEKYELRILSRALTDCPLTDDEWRQSRRAIVALIKERTREDDVIEPDVIEPTHGARINVPHGFTAEDLCRKGMALEADGVPPDQVSVELGVGVHTYRKMRDIVLLSDRPDLSSKDAATADRALRILNGTDQLSQAWPLVEPIVARIWGNGAKGSTRENVERLRNERFEHAFGLLLQACETVAAFDIPYLSEARVGEACAQLDTATRNLAALKRRISEVRG